MRKTAEGYTIESETEEVWEIMYRYVNPEFSRAEPEKRMVRDIPKGIRVWKHQANCRLECFRLNRSKPYQFYEEPKFLSISFQPKSP